MTNIYEAPQRSFLVALLLSILLGTLGVDRFYLGKVGTGLLKLITPAASASGGSSTSSSSSPAP